MIKGAIDLPLVCARVFDPDNIGMDYWRSSANSDGRPRSAFERRMQCYELILDSLSVFEQQGNEPSTVQNAHSAEEHETVKDYAYQLSFSSDDEMFHSTLYDWLISRHLADDLLEVCWAFSLLVLDITETCPSDTASFPGDTSQA